MESLERILGRAVTAAFSAAGFAGEPQKAGVSNRPDLCEYQSNGALALAKKLHKNPMEIAEAVAGRLQETREGGLPLFSKAEAAKPGFLNLDLHPDFLASYLNGMAADSALGLGQELGGKRILVDYGGANVAKPLHVGHLRSAVIGEAVKRLCRKMGNEAIGDVHLGDWGLQMGLIIEELRERGRLWEEFSISELEEIYPEASRKAKAVDAEGKPLYPGFAERAHEATLRLQEGDPACRKVWERILRVSVEDLRKNYDALDVHFELWKGESDAQPYIPGLIQDLVDQGLAYESQGALVVDIAEPSDKKELPPCMVRKSDGAALYATSDLGTILEREKLYAPDRYIYIADSRQSLHYTQFFRVARKAGFVRPEVELDFIGFGTMNGKDRKPFKTREGGVLRLESLIEETRQRVLERIRATRGEEMPEEEAEGSARQIAIAALKYGDLANQASKDYVFDMDKFTAFEGNTGPYILYTIVRISSIFRKYAGMRGMPMTRMEDFALEHGAAFPIRPLGEEGGRNGHAMQLLLAEYQDCLKGAFCELAPHKICAYIYELSNAFNSFYHDVKILKEADEDKQRGYLATLLLTYRVLTDCISVLGFSAPERM